MSEAICYPVCQSCREKCYLAPKKQAVRAWKCDVVKLECGQVVPMPVWLFGHFTVWCEIHDKWEKPARKPKKRKDKLPDEPLF